MTKSIVSLVKRTKMPLVEDSKNDRKREKEKRKREASHFSKPGNRTPPGSQRFYRRAEELVPRQRVVRPPFSGFPSVDETFDIYFYYDHPVNASIPLLDLAQSSRLRKRVLVTDTSISLFQRSKNRDSDGRSIVFKDVDRRFKYLLV